jgi:hypothetical protein
MRYLTNTFSPMMLETLREFEGREISLAEAKTLAANAVSAISHEVTAAILSALLGREVKFNRMNLVLRRGDEVVCVIPGFRATESREFTHEEVASAGFRCWLVVVK